MYKVKDSPTDRSCEALCHVDEAVISPSSLAFTFNNSKGREGEVGNISNIIFVSQSVQLVLAFPQSFLLEQCILPGILLRILNAPAYSPKAPQNHFILLVLE